MDVPRRLAREHRFGGDDLRAAVPGLSATSLEPGPRAGAAVLSPARARRLRSPLLLALAALLTIEAVGGIAIFFARLAFGTLPGETLHVIAGVALCAVYAAYQWSHWTRVRPFRARLDHALGLIAAIFMAATNLTGLALGLAWWRARESVANSGPAAYDPPLSAAHNLASMVVLTFVAAHVGAVLLRDRRRAGRAPRSAGGS